MDISYTKTMTDDEINEDYELRDYLINEFKSRTDYISKPYEEITTRDLLTLYNVIIK